MYSRNSFGSYYPVNSTIHKLNPVIKLINFIITIVLLLATSSTHITCFMLVFVIIMMMLSYVPIKYYFNTFYSLRYLYLILAFVCAYFKVSLELYLIYVAKIVILVEHLNILAYTTSPSESIYGIEKFLNVFNFLYLNVSKIAFKINSSLRYIPLYMAVKYKTLKSSSSRGITYSSINIFKKMIAY